jgi:hypothetical protein
MTQGTVFGDCFRVADCSSMQFGKYVKYLLNVREGSSRETGSSEYGLGRTPCRNLEFPMVP